MVNPDRLSLYAMVAAKGGVRFPETKQEDLRISPLFGVMCWHTAARRGVIEMQGCPMTALAESLGSNGRSDLGRKVIDQTGLNGHYTFVLHWARSDAAPAADDVSTAAPSWPSIFTAVNEQLGLELKPIKGPLDVIVIDHAEMPSEN
jgi:uncharacterized protein (TIGR03435 family)